jgi:hypothetical protein
MEDIDQDSEPQGSQVVQPSDSTHSSAFSGAHPIEPDVGDLEFNIEKKRNWFRKMFGRTTKAKDSAPFSSGDHQIIVDDIESNDASEDGAVSGTSSTPMVNYPPATSVDAAIAAAAMRPVDLTLHVNRNWFAKIFVTQPAPRIICLVIPKPRARKEIFKILVGWEQHGLKDLVVGKDKGGDVFRARVDAENCELHTPFDP